MSVLAEITTRLQPFDWVSWGGGGSVPLMKSALFVFTKHVYMKRETCKAANATSLEPSSSNLKEKQMPMEKKKRGCVLFYVIVMTDRS